MALLGVAAPASAQGTIAVNTTTDEFGTGASCSLREAIQTANFDTNFGGCTKVGTVPYTINVPAGTYTLTLANAGGVNEDANATGDLDVLTSLTIAGAGSGSTFIQAGTTNANGIDKVFGINPVCDVTVDVTIQGVTIRFGRNTQPYGSGDFSFTGGGLDYCGNGAGSFTLKDSVVTDNTNTDGYGGGINVDEALGAASTISIQNSTIQNNTSKYWGGGINLFGDNPTVTFTGSTITGNQTLGTSGVGGAGGGINIRLTNGNTVTVDSTDISLNQGIAYGGGVTVAGGGTQSVFFQNGTTITGNTAHVQTLAGPDLNSVGGGIAQDAAVTTTLSDTDISGNQAKEQGDATQVAQGGGIWINAGDMVLNGGVTVSTNESMDGAGIFSHAASAVTQVNGPTVTFLGNLATRDGGGIYVDAGTVSITKATIRSNVADSDINGTGKGGAAFNNGGSLTMTFNRVASNVVGASTASGLRQVAGTSSVNNNWWGCSSDPTAGGTTCDAVSSGGGTLTLAKWMRVKLTPTSPTIVTNQTTPLQANVNSNSANEALALTDVVTLIGQSLTWSGVLGTVSGAAATIQSDGTATATFQATGAGSASAAVKLDNDATTGVRSNVAAITVNKAGTTVGVLSETPDPTVTGQPFAVSFNATGAFTNSPTAPTGNVTVSLGSDSCTATLATGFCNVAVFTVGSPVTLSVTYAGDGNFNGNTFFQSHTVNKADTTANVVAASDTPDPSGQGQPVLVSVTVTANSPGAGTPTGGTFSVSDGVDFCTGTLSAGTGSCSVSLTTLGSRTLSAGYAGDASYNSASAGSTESHFVKPFPTVVVSVNPTPSNVGQSTDITADVSGSAGAPTGTVQFKDNGNAIGAAQALSGGPTATATLTGWSFSIAGTHSVTAEYGGDGTYAANIGTVSHVVKGTPATVGQLVISEFRFCGSTALDEYIEIYNTLGSAHTVATDDGSAGYAVAKSDGTLLFTIPNGTVIPSKGHYLGINTAGYTLGAAAAMDTGAAWTVDIPDNTGIALFKSATTLDSTTRIDSAGFVSESQADYKEGGGIPDVPAVVGQFAFVRKNASGTVQDTNDNALDFNLVSVDASAPTGSAMLGAPGPENLASPIDRSSGFSALLIEPLAGVNNPPNRIRTGTGSSGTLEFRRRLKNNTASSITKLRLRVVTLTTKNSPGYATVTQSDLRPVTGPGGTVTITPTTSIGVSSVNQLTLETPPTQAIGGGVNSTLAATTVTLGTPLGIGATLDVNIVLQIFRLGTYNYFLVVEALP